MPPGFACKGAVTFQADRAAGERIAVEPIETHAQCNGHACGHADVDVADTSGRSLLLTLGLNLLIPAAQVVGGIMAGSMALISDAVHNFSDFIAVLIAYVAHRLGQRGASERNTFGYRRAEVLAAAANVVLLVAASIFIVYESIERFSHPESISGKLVMVFAGVGVLGNGLSALILHRDSKHSLNVRGAFLHMLGDLLTSVAVLASGLALMFRPWYWLDPLLSLLIVVFILKNCWGILRESVDVLMNATPAGLDIRAVKDSIEQTPGVVSAHHLHAWRICATSVAFTCHVVVSDHPVSWTERLRDDICRALHDRFGLDHAVLQFETVPCTDSGMLCAGG